MRRQQHMLLYKTKLNFPHYLVTSGMSIQGFPRVQNCRIHWTLIQIGKVLIHPPQPKPGKLRLKLVSILISVTEQTTHFTAWAFPGWTIKNTLTYSPLAGHPFNGIMDP
ncbi:hypothetical protein DUNSADRAFT_3140 [Dunaliella salina]|uniref:Encoded protein n=1 Tax=Dunaliella salina TaxID=3046 RepID=A0ABQ7H832_DUNSA|nr:hypothetical protein DUNSADRAFT_3140 [Dunaliella salina]|eukprot:KAF5843011.1 hypothetical protein DUNSADRAFT_3140 [Dunaliella salina]